MITPSFINSLLWHSIGQKFPSIWVEYFYFFVEIKNLCRNKKITKWNHCVGACICRVSFILFHFLLKTFFFFFTTEYFSQTNISLFSKLQNRCKKATLVELEKLSRYQKGHAVGSKRIKEKKWIKCLLIYVKHYICRFKVSFSFDPHSSSQMKKLRPQRYISYPSDRQ